MRTVFNDKSILGILCVLPENEIDFDDEVSNYNFPERQTMRLKKLMGYDRHRITKDTSTVSDYAIFGINYLLDNGLINKNEIGAIITVTLCPDYFLPHVSNIIHGEIGFDTETLCMDIAQGCCGFILGLMQSFMLLEHMPEKKVLLVNGDVLTKRISKHDRNDYPIAGDTTTITLVENSALNPFVPMEIYMDGKRRDVLRIPAGGFKTPSTPETAVLTDQGDGNLRALDHMHMDGTEVFNFMMMEVPPMLTRAFEKYNVNIQDIDYFLFHQPNKFMLKKLAEKAGIPEEKLFMNIVENYGNPNGASIPLTIAHNLSDELLNKTLKCCLSGFGSGVAWGVTFLNLGPMDFCEIIESDL